MAQDEKDYRTPNTWCVELRKDNHGRNRRSRWWLWGKQRSGHPWSIAKTREGYVIFSDPAGHDHPAKTNHIAGPFPTLEAAQVVYTLMASRE